MSEKGFDALVATSQENNAYFSDIAIKGFCVLPQSGEATLIARVLDAPILAQTPSWIPDVFFYGLFHIVPSDSQDLAEAESRMNELIRGDSFVKAKKDPVETLVKVVAQKGLEQGTLGIDCGGIRPSQLEAIENRLPKAKLVDASQDIAWMRSVKTPEEVARIEAATKATERGFDAAEEIAHEGASEKELAVAFRRAVADDEEMGIRMYRFLGGGRGAFPLAPPTDYRLKRGDLIQLHASLAYRYYQSDIARGAVVGRPSEEQLRVWRAIVKGEEAIIENVEPGVKASELFKIGVRTVRDAGLPGYQRWHTGHGIGLGGVESYDPPILAPEDERELEENMVLCIETPYYKIGFGGLNLEDTGVVTKTGFRLLSSHRVELRVV